MNVVFLASYGVNTSCVPCVKPACTRSVTPECDASNHIIHAGVPSLEKLVSFDQVRSERDFEQEVIRWSQQVRHLYTVSSL